MISSFSFPTKISFGPGVISSIHEKLKLLGVSRPLLVTDAGLARTPVFQKFRQLGGDAWKYFAEVKPNPTLEDVQNTLAAYQGCDSVIAVGGGSVLDVGKAVRLLIKKPDADLKQFKWTDDWSGLVPCITIPTTAGTGSEVGRSSVIIIDGRKSVLFHPKLLADFVFLDPEITTGLPPLLTAATGADALTHCIESFTSPEFHPLCDGIALEGARISYHYLRRAVQDGNDLEARGQMLIAAMMGGIAFQKDLGATHSLAHPLSSVCGLHHGTANALCLPFVMEFNSARKPGLYMRVAQTLGLKETSDAAAISAVRELFQSIGLPAGLRAYGVGEQHLDEMTEQAFADPCHKTNPVPVSKSELKDLYQKAL